MKQMTIAEAEAEAEAEYADKRSDRNVLAATIAVMD